MSILLSHLAGGSRGGHPRSCARSHADRGGRTHQAGGERAVVAGHQARTRLRGMPGRGRSGMTDPLAVLQRIRETKPRDIPRAGEVCELCAVPIPDEHGHMVDLEARNLMCACRGCYLLFVSEGAGGAHFRSVPDRYLAFPDYALTPEKWDNLQIPVSVAFFFLNSSLGR